MKKVKQNDMTLRALCELCEKSIVIKDKVTYRPYFMAKTNLFCGMHPERAEVIPGHFFVREEENCVYLHLEIKGIETRTFFAYPISENNKNEPYFVSWLCDDVGSYLNTQECGGEIYWCHSKWQLKSMIYQAEEILKSLKADYANAPDMQHYNNDQWATVFCENQDEEYVTNLFRADEDGIDEAYTNVVTPDMMLRDIVLLDFT